MSKRKKRIKDLQSKALLRSAKAKVKRFNRAMDGDADALVECMYDRGMCTREQFNDYFKIKKEYGGEGEEI